MVFVTGGTGFVGAHFLYHLVNRGEQVLALRRATSDLNYVRNVFEFYEAHGEKKLEQIEWIEGDVLELHHFQDRLRDVKTIFHLAALVSFDPGEQYRMKEINLQGTANMVNLALENNISSLVYMSSVGALDPVKPGEMITEENYGNNPKRSSRYAETKFKSELEVWRGIEEGLNAVIVNPSVVLGPGLPAQGPGKIFQRLRKGLRYYPQGITGFVDVRDVCHSTLQLFDEGVFNERFIISEGNYAYKDLFEMICHEMGVKAPKKPLSPNLTALAWRLEKARSKLFNSKPQITKEIHRSANNQVYFSNEKIKEQLGYEFIPIKQTIKDTTLFYNFQD